MPLLEERFTGKELYRVHRSYLINPKKVIGTQKRGARDYWVSLKDTSGAPILLPIARSYLDQCMREHAEWFKKKFGA